MKLTLLSAGLLASLTFAAHAASPDLAASVAKIDALVLDGLKKNSLEPNAPVSDSVFVRRIYLDIAGRIPTLKETKDFLADTAADKRVKLIDALMESPAYTQNMFNYWGDILRYKSQMTGGGQSAPAGYAYAKWLKDALASNMPYDKMVSELVSADGKSYENGAVGFYIRDYNMPLDNMAVTTQIFLGTSMVCAQCHNHPFDKWTQMDYYEMAAHTNGMTGSNGLTNPLLAQAIYGSAPKKSKGKGKGGKSAVAKMDLPDGVLRADVSKAVTEILRPLRFNTILDESHRKALKLPHDYQYTDAKPNEVIAPTIPVAFAKDGNIVKDGKKPVEAYADWMTSKENPRFTTVIANRLWKKAMGQGLIEPVDEITDSTVPSNPKLMAYLEETMKALNYDMKAFLKTIYNSQSYQRTASTKEVLLGDVYHFPGPVLRRMSAEQIWDSVVTLYKPNPDTPSFEARLTADTAIRRVEWLDRALNSLTPEELKGYAIKIAQTQKQLAKDVREAQQKLNEASKDKDEDALRKAKAEIKSQRSRIDEAVEDIVFTAGFKKFAQMAREGKLQEFVDDPEFIKEINQVIKGKNGADLEIDEALNLLAKTQRTRYTELQKQRLQADAERFNVKLKGKENGASSLKSWELLRDTSYVRSADLRSPSPNGHFLRDFGQSDREIVENSNDDASVTQALTLLNGKVFSQLMNPFTAIARSMASAKEKGGDAVIDTVYLSLLSRPATEDERTILREVADNADATDRGDVLWTVLNTRQFFFIE